MQRFGSQSFRHIVVCAAVAIVCSGAGPAASAVPAVPAVPAAVTHHTARIGDRSIRYTATAGTIVLRNAKDEPAANVFYVAYVADDLGPKARRPITFAYNGGPGGSSALVHLGAFGPRMVLTANAVTTRPPPYEIVDNTQSLLDVSDLVFVDAVGTGYSRLAEHGTAKDFYGVEADGHAFAQFIRRYVTQNDRWNSPKYLAGESYGTTRSAVTANMLQHDGVVLSGITLMSTVLDFSTLIAQSGNDQPYWMFLPTEAAVAAFHHRLVPQPGDILTFLQTVRAFAQGPYAAALAKGASLTLNERDAVAAQLHAYTSLPVDYIVRSQLRIAPERFEKQLLGNENETVGRYDGRFREFDVDPVGDSADTDPSADAIFGAFTGAFNRYIRDELHYVTDLNYNFLNEEVGKQWQWHRGENGSPAALSVGDDLRDVLTANPFLRVFSANGIYDLATPFLATEYSLTHLGLNPSLQPHISFGYYCAGHMIYLNPAAHAQLKRDLAAFYR